MSYHRANIGDKAKVLKKHVRHLMKQMLRTPNQDTYNNARKRLVRLIASSIDRRKKMALSAKEICDIIFRYKIFLIAGEVPITREMYELCECSCNETMYLNKIMNDAVEQWVFRIRMEVKGHSQRNTAQYFALLRRSLDGSPCSLIDSITAGMVKVGHGTEAYLMFQYEIGHMYGVMSLMREKLSNGELRIAHVDVLQNSMKDHYFVFPEDIEKLHIRYHHADYIKLQRIVMDDARRQVLSEICKAMCKLMLASWGDTPDLKAYLDFSDKYDVIGSYLSQVTPRETKVNMWIEYGIDPVTQRGDFDTAGKKLGMDKFEILAALLRLMHGNDD